MAARITKSLDVLRNQVNALAPKRSKTSDGWLGDAKHSMRKSDHNPEPDGTVDAFDLTHDPKHGVDIQQVCDAIVASRDRRVSYLICNGKIIAGNSGPKPWLKRSYSGPNKHTKHLHVSVLDAHQDDTTPWQIDAAFREAVDSSAPPSGEDRQPVGDPANRLGGPVPTAPAPEPSVGQSRDTVLYVQTRLHELGYSEVGSLDGRMGTMTRAAILSFRSDNGLALSAEIDDALLIALPKATQRKLSPARTEATAAEVREEVPEVKSNFFAKVWGLVAGAGAMFAGAFNFLAENLAVVKEKAQPVLDVAGDIPIWLYLAVFGGFAFWLWQQTRKGEAKGVEAYQAGERR